MHCPICGQLERGRHHCPPKILEAIDRADREADDIGEADEASKNFAERLETGFELLALAGD